MVSIICTVGTSSIGKLRKKSTPLVDESHDFYNGFFNELEGIKQDYLIYGLEKNRSALNQLFCNYALNYFKKCTDYYGHFDNWEENEEVWNIMPAEVVSTIRIIQKLKLSSAEVDIKLLGTDTADGYIATRILEFIFENYNFDVNYTTVSGYQLNNMDVFRMEGLKNFVFKVKEIVDNSNHVLFNITGGYKNFIPLVTHISSFYQLEMYYVFEEMVKMSNSIVLIPNVPNFNRILFDVDSNVDKYKVINNIIDEVAENEFSNFRDVEQHILDRLGFEFKDMGETFPIILTEFITKFFEVNDNKVSMTIFGYLYKNLLLS